MKTVLKILIWPFTAVLTILIWLCAAVISRAAILFGLASSILSALALLVFLAGYTKNGAIVTVIAFLISPLGLPMLAARLLVGLAEVNAALKKF